ncbi:hypothetical protein FKP32DRAFT_1577150 [Trametes sanguinea]|nr:hypothetical protein FKP32DRAFT_1577150 [Trametes sanguinea]
MRVDDLHSESDDDETVVRIHAGHVAHAATIRRKESTPETVQPIRDKRLNATLTAVVEINGLQAYALFDSGSTTDSVSPEFAYLARVQRIPLEQQVVLQLGCAGSRSKISYGTRTELRACGVTTEHYFDIVNLDRYDCILGTPFMNGHNVILDFERRVIRVGDREYAAFSYDEDVAYRKEWREKKGRAKGAQADPPAS